MGSYTCLRVSGIVLAVLDLLFSMYVLGFYVKMQFDKYHCYWAHGIRSCDFFMHDTNHNTRTIIGIAMAFISIGWAIVLLYAFIKRKPMLGWSWLLKAVVMIGINAYFVSDWLIKRGRFYHSYWDPAEYNEESLFITQGTIELVVQLLFAIIFCVLNAFFTYKKNRVERARKIAESEI